MLCSQSLYFHYRRLTLDATKDKQQYYLAIIDQPNQIFNLKFPFIDHNSKMLPLVRYLRQQVRMISSLLPLVLLCHLPRKMRNMSHQTCHNLSSIKTNGNLFRRKFPKLESMIFERFSKYFDILSIMYLRGKCLLPFGWLWYVQLHGLIPTRVASFKNRQRFILKPCAQRCLLITIINLFVIAMAFSESA